MTRYNLLVKTNKNIFNVDDLIAIWSTSNRRDALESIKGYINRGKIFSIFKGIYALDKNYDKLELSQKLFPPSYVTYYSALTAHGIVFQKYKDIHLFASNSKIITVDNQKYIFHKAKQSVLLNHTGVGIDNNYNIASPERAVCDSLYINKSIAFDNLRNIDIEKLEKVSRIYGNKRLKKDIHKLILSLGKGHEEYIPIPTKPRF